MGLENTPRTLSGARCRIYAGRDVVVFGLRGRGLLAFRARRPASPVFHTAVLLAVRGCSAVALLRRDPRRCPVCPGLWFSIREAYRKPWLFSDWRAQVRTAENATPSNPTTLVDVEPLDEHHHPRRRAASASPNPGFRQQQKPLRTLLRGFYAVRHQASKPDISAGQVAVSAIPGPKPVSGLVNSPTVAAGVLCRAKGIPPDPLRPTATVADVELFGAYPVRAERGSQQ